MLPQPRTTAWMTCSDDRSEAGNPARSMPRSTQAAGSMKLAAVEAMPATASDGVYVALSAIELRRAQAATDLEVARLELRLARQRAGESEQE